LAIVRLHQLPGNGQTQAAPGPAGVRARPIAAPETIKDIGQILGRDALQVAPTDYLLSVCRKGVKKL